METPFSLVRVPAIRSNQGCWTCRLRKKKCDEVSPGCLRCASVNVECHYGPRPPWIDNVLLGKQELEHIKKIVGASANRKRAAFRAKTQNAMKSPSIENAKATVDDRSPAETLDDTLELESQPNAVSVTSPLPLQPVWVDDHEASLMMHYLDHVFFIQFRFYSPSISAGGRGWLLSLLTQTKPLYHAALSLSACLALEGDEAQTDYLKELERHHNLALKELQLFIQAHGAHGEHASTAFGSNVQILACMLFHGGVSTWQVHLRAASEIVLLLHGLSVTSNSASPAPANHSPPSSELLGSDAIPKHSLSADNAALKFFTGAIIWFDVLACISTSTRPYLSGYHDRLSCLSESSLHGENDSIQLHSIMGCENWAMIAIGEVAKIKAWKEEGIRSGSLDIHHFAEVARKLQAGLESNNLQVHVVLDRIRSDHSGPPPHHRTILYNTYTTLVITRIFACAALIYLQTVISSDPSVLNISTGLQDVMTAMTYLPDPRMFRGLVWPLCVAGCMASSQLHQEFFRNTIMGSVKDSPMFGNSAQALQILERSWEMQRERGRLIDCATTIQEMGTYVLLV
ncbi:Pestheic acid cluster transcriptional regulator 3 [Hyphodiscus hymeniophilus]|uniref:Pestheic acid cluster transcriptional regulator 3 n=1 Tax=Hyphodiscus hymeniophilus TaxID=353542 RepID=A0A9P6VDW1_9HELO|nr:Pestheic acid cluster transcriptional regulator 3 [Hyphodiscus hymeniophilus]